MRAGCPATCDGEIFEVRAACSAADRSRGWPLIALAETTLPLSSTSTWTRTSPDAPAARAEAGYNGVVRLVARPLSTPPLTGGRLTGGVGVTCGVAVGRGRVFVFDSVLPSSSGDGEGEGDGVGDGLGVGVGVFTFAFTLAFTFAFVLKLKFVS